MHITDISVSSNHLHSHHQKQITTKALTISQQIEIDKDDLGFNLVEIERVAEACVNGRDSSSGDEGDEEESQESSDDDRAGLTKKIVELVSTRSESKPDTDELLNEMKTLDISKS